MKLPTLWLRLGKKSLRFLPNLRRKVSIYGGGGAAIPAGLRLDRAPWQGPQVPFGVVCPGSVACVP